MASEDTKLAILRAAEVLFADKGIDAVSMREISLAAGQINPSASGYHFGEKVNIIDAILVRHVAEIQDSWLVALDEPSDFSIRELVEMFTIPLVNKLDDPDNGPQFIQFATQLCTHPTWPLDDRPSSQSPGRMRLAEAMRTKIYGDPLLTPFPPELARLRVQRITNLLYSSVCNYDRLGRRVARHIFISDLVDSLTAVISSVSATTLDVLQK